MNYWTQEQLDGRFTVDQIRFMTIKQHPEGYTVKAASGQFIPPPRPDGSAGPIWLICGFMLGIASGLAIWCLIDWLKTL